LRRAKVAKEGGECGYHQRCMLVTLGANRNAVLPHPKGNPAIPRRMRYDATVHLSLGLARCCAGDALIRDRMVMTATFSVVVPTLGRSWELRRLLESLELQAFDGLEVVVVDRSSDNKISDMLSGRQWSFNLIPIRTPKILGTSYAMNTGWPRTTGPYILFADDDCWYPPETLARVRELFTKTGGDILTGRSESKSLGRYEKKAQPITRRNVWTTSIEWMMFFRREVVEAVDGYDPTIGLGADTPWQSAPGQDIVLRALQKGFRGYFDPSLYGFHPEVNTIEPDAAMCTKARAYGRGMGYILRRHRFGIAEVAHWIARPSAAAALYYVKGQRQRASYYLNMAHGRFEGWCSNAELPALRT